MNRRVAPNRPNDNLKKFVFLRQVQRHRRRCRRRGGARAVGCRRNGGNSRRVKTRETRYPPADGRQEGY